MPAILSFCLALATGAAWAQGLPSTAVWLGALEDGVPINPVLISDGGGYNNQPRFSADGRVIWYTREMPGADGPQTDVAAFDIATGSTTMITASTASEYSPTPVPGRATLSVVRVEADQRQRLWEVDLAGAGTQLLLPEIEPVGYHAWLSESEVALFILGDSFTLQLARVGDAGARLVAENIGRSLRRHPASGEILFVDKNHAPWRIMAYDPASGARRKVVALFPGREDFTVDAAGHYWTGNGGKLYRYKPGGSRWELMADFTDIGIRNISRLAVHLESGQIAMVSD